MLRVNSLASSNQWKNDTSSVLWNCELPVVTIMLLLCNCVFRRCSLQQLHYAYDRRHQNTLCSLVYSGIVTTKSSMSTLLVIRLYFKVNSHITCNFQAYFCSSNAVDLHLGEFCFRPPSGCCELPWLWYHMNCWGRACKDWYEDKAVSSRQLRTWQIERGWNVLLISNSQVQYLL
jgi:hypothetical protein